MNINTDRLGAYAHRGNFRTVSFAMLAFLLLVAIGITWTITLRQAGGYGMTSMNSTNLLRSGWSYLPGTSVAADGIHVAYIGRHIVQQDGSGGQENPAINLYGTHFRTSGDFTMIATLSDIKGAASLRLYDSVPIIQDEFRVESKSLNVSLNDAVVSIERWNSYSGQRLAAQSSAESDKHAFTPQKNNDVTIERRAGRISISINGAQIASLSNNDFLSTENVWIGLDAKEPGDSWTLSKLETQGGISPVDTESNSAVAKESTGFQSLASLRRPGFFVGAAVALGPLISDNQYAELVLGGNFGQMTMENALKWQFVEPRPGVFDFHEADALLAIAQKNNLRVHGHTLVFAEANPTWVRQLPIETADNRQRIKQVMQDHITALVGHYRAKIGSWDVVNEPLDDDNVLRRSIWHQAMGDDYIKIAFETARATDPAARLYINEYGLEADGERWDTFLALVTRLKAQGVPLDGVGFQAHVYDMGEDAIDPIVLRSHIQALARIGLAVRISEIDVDPSEGPVKQAEQYAETLNVCVTEPNCVSWTTWGVSDAYNMWQDDNKRLQYGEDFLWDAHYQSKQAVDAMKRTLSMPATH